MLFQSRQLIIMIVDERQKGMTFKVHLHMYLSATKFNAQEEIFGKCLQLQGLGTKASPKSLDLAL